MLRQLPPHHGELCRLCAGFAKQTRATRPPRSGKSSLAAKPPPRHSGGVSIRICPLLCCCSLIVAWDTSTRVSGSHLAAAYRE